MFRDYVETRSVLHIVEHWASSWRYLYLRSRSTFAHANPVREEIGLPFASSESTRVPIKAALSVNPEIRWIQIPP
jgi:hypothetical protein